MLSPDRLHGYQHAAISHVVDNKQSMLWLDMGLGKTVSTLTAILELINRMEVWGVLVVAPLRVCQSVWRQEANEWSHLRGKLSFSALIGEKHERERALFTKADIYLINYEGLPWLARELEHRWLQHGHYLPFNMVVWDEISKMKNTRAVQGVARGKAALQITPYIHRSVGLTGTPASNGLTDLFGQFLVVDHGERLGTSYEAYRVKYFYQADRNGYKYLPFPGSDEALRDIIGDITVTMSAKDYLELPPLLVNDVVIDMPPSLLHKYKQMEKEFLLSFDSGAELEIFNKASLSNRCLQFANGACYVAPGSPVWEKIHEIKLDALDDIVEEAAGKPVLVAYQFKHDAERILKRHPHAVRISSKISDEEFNVICQRWNAGEISMLLGHPASIGHGLNIQAGGNIVVWFGLTWSLDLFDQLNARLCRQGQLAAVVVMHRILLNHTLDLAQRIALADKASCEGDMRAAVEKYRREAA